MKAYRDLTIALSLVLGITLGLLVAISALNFRQDLPTLFYVSASVFSATLVVLLVVVFMYFHSRNLEIIMLKRRSNIVYSELQQHKMKIVDAMDGEKPLSEWDNFLYSENEFPRSKKFVIEEYFLLIRYEPFYTSNGNKAVLNFHWLHKELENFLRSVLYDGYEYSKFRKQYQKEHGRDMTAYTPEDEFTAPQLNEAYDAIWQALEYSLQNADNLLKLVDALLKNMDKHFCLGMPWKLSKASFDAELKIWMNANK